MAFLKKEFKDRILDRVNKDSALLLEMIQEECGEPKERGAEWRFACPSCGGALKVSPKKMIFKCYGCPEVKGKNAVNFLMGPGPRLSFDEAISRIARQHYHLEPEYEEERRPMQPASRKKKDGGEPASYCARMLAESGLTKADVTAHVRLAPGDDGFRETPTFTKGTLNERYEIDPEGDDVVIRYYDIEGNPVTYTFMAKGQKPVERPYFRIRYQFPDAHKDRSGTPMKYRSPYGSPTFIYYPEAIRKAFREKDVIERLYIQEGEKKAEKACKHGIPSVAVSGIQNLGDKEHKLPQDLIKLIRECKVREVVFLMDSDLHDLSKSLSETKPVNQRPSAFFSAVAKYQQYMAELVNQNIYIEIFYGHVLKNEAGDKGIDDLLTDSLAGKEEQLLQDLEFARHDANLTGKWVRLYNITTASTAKIKEQFYLQSAQIFCEHYKEQLKDMREFTCMGWKYRFSEKGELESASPVERDEQFWEEDETRRGNPLKFVYTKAMTFLERRGFHVFERGDDNYFLVRVEKGIVRAVAPRKVANFIHEFTRANLPEAVRELLLRGGTQYIGPYQLEQLSAFQGSFFDAPRGLDYFYFRDKAWKITEDGVSEEKLSDLRFNIWSDAIHDFADIELLQEPLFTIRHDGDEDGWFASLTEAGKRCHFLQFLANASNFSWRKKKPSDDDLENNAQHLASKLAALGYLANTRKDRSMAKAVISMDGKMQEFSEMNGRSGKSLFGLALKQVFPRYKAVNGKALGAGNINPFIWEGVDERTRMVICDDVMEDFRFELIFSLVTDDWPVNPKGGTEYTVPFERAPKVYISSNFSVVGDGGSYRARQWPLAFSDYYNEDHQPTDDFGALFFEEWDADQWTLFWNLVAQCMQAYFRYGCIPIPDNRLEDRRLAQQIGEDFMGWADEYFDPDGGHINKRLLRQDMYRAFTEYVQEVRGTKVSYSSKSFSMRMGYYVRLKKLRLNPHLYDPKTDHWLTYDKDGRPVKTDKSNGKEYYIIGDADFYRNWVPAAAQAPAPELGPGIFPDMDDEEEEFEKS